MTKKRFLCGLLILCLLLSVGCGDKKTTENAQTEKTQTEQARAKELQLLYSATDTFNPYTASTELNRQLCQLLYEPLVAVDDTYQPVYRLAKSVTVNEKTCTVQLKNTLFSDGSTVTAADVVYSAGLAKNSTTRYAESFYEISSFSAASNDTVVFKLSQNDPYFANLLDFPILKKESDRNTDEDGVLQPPIGNGRYLLSDEKDRLFRNENYYGQKGTALQIRLINAPDTDSISHYVEIGATDLYFTDVADGKIVRMSGRRTEVNLNRLVYVGYNAQNALMKQPELRYAISSALDRSAICQTAFNSNALAATGLLNPLFRETASLQNIKNTADLKISVENLAKIGYNNLNNEGYYANQNGKHITLTLLVNQENTPRVAAAEAIAAQLKTAGIEIRVEKKPYAAYVKLLEAGAFQLYLGEVRIYGNMDLSPLISPDGAVAYGLRKTKKTNTESTTVSDKDESDTESEETKKTATQQSVTAAEILKGYHNGTYSVSDVVTACQTELPIIPVCYRLGLLFYDSDVLTPDGVSCDNLFSSTATGR